VQTSWQALELSMKFPAFYETWKLITMITRAHCLYLSEPLGSRSCPFLAHVLQHVVIKRPSVLVLQNPVITQLSAYTPQHPIIKQPLAYFSTTLYQKPSVYIPQHPVIKQPSAHDLQHPVNKQHQLLFLNTLLLNNPQPMIFNTLLTNNISSCSSKPCSQITLSI